MEKGECGKRKQRRTHHILPLGCCIFFRRFTGKLDGPNCSYPSTCTSIKPQCGLYFLFLRLFFVGLYSHLALLSDVTIPTFFSSLADTFIESIFALALWTEILNLMVCSFSGNIPVETEAAYLCVQCFRADATLVLQEAVVQDAILAANPIQEALLLRLPSPYSQLSASKLLFDILYNELPA